MSLEHRCECHSCTQARRNPFERAIEQAGNLSVQLQAADALAKAVSIMNRILDFGDRIYEVREREGMGWEGPKVTEYGKAHTEFTKALATYETVRGVK